MYLGIGKVATMIGVSHPTLRRWDEANSFSASYKTLGGIVDVNLLTAKGK